jgi:separase
VVCDIRRVLEELDSKSTKSEPETSKSTKSDPETSSPHIFLILDNQLQSFPWESIPCLQGRSTSRIPSLSFLQDRLDLAIEGKSELWVNPSRTSYVLNPKGDLKNTQATFEPLLEGMRDVGWKGVIGRCPSETEMKDALSNDLFL